MAVSRRKNFGQPPYMYIYIFIFMYTQTYIYMYIYYIYGTRPPFQKISWDCSKKLILDGRLKRQKVMPPSLMEGKHVFFGATSRDLKMSQVRLGLEKAPLPCFVLWGYLVHVYCMFFFYRMMNVNLLSLFIINIYIYIFIYIYLCAHIMRVCIYKFNSM